MMSIEERFLNFEKPAEDLYPPLKKHLRPLFNAALNSPGKTMLELGSETGTSTIALLYGAEKKGSFLYSVDTSPCTAAHDRIKVQDLHQYWKFLQEDDRNLDTIFTEFQLPKEHQFGLILIDTSHEREHTWEEITLYSPHVLPGGGFLIFHDYNMSDVSIPVNVFLSTNPEFQAVDCPKNEHGIMLMILQRKTS